MIFLIVIVVVITYGKLINQKSLTKLKMMSELRYCEKCVQMTNHRKTELPLVIVYDCLKCEKTKECDTNENKE